MQDNTYVLPDGRTLWSKYQNITNLEVDNHVFLASNGKVAVSLIQAGKEYFAGGPTKQELTVHDFYDGEILLWHPVHEPLRLARARAGPAVRGGHAVPRNSTLPGPPGDTTPGTVIVPVPSGSDS